MANIETIRNVLKEIQASYPNWKADEGTIRAYTFYFRDISDDLLIAAVRDFISTSTHGFAPSIPEIRNKASGLQVETMGIPNALQAWDEVCRATKPRDRRYPLYRDGQIVEDVPYKWRHKMVEVCARRFGWPEFPGTETEMADRSQFMRAYEAMVKEETSHATRLPEVSAWVEERKSFDADRRSALDTGERAQIMRELTRGMER